MIDDKRLTSLTDDGESPDWGAVGFDRRAQIVALGVLLGVCLLWVGLRSVLHKAVPTSLPAVVKLADGVLATDVRDSQSARSRAPQDSNIRLAGSATNPLREAGERRTSSGSASAGVPANRSARNQASVTNFASAPASCGRTTSLIHLNTATAAQLDSLPGVGPVLAQRIVAWRDAHKGFSDVHELQEVPGIGPSKFARIRGQVSVQ